MIRLKHTVLLVSMAFAGACATADAPAPTPTPAPPDHGCPGSSPLVVPININYGASPIVVAPPTQTADAGQVLQFNLIGTHPPPDVGPLVSTAGKTAEAGWLNGSGKRKNAIVATHQFYICVPKDLFPPNAPSGATLDFGYNVNAVGKPQLDPVVRVRNP